MHATLHLTRSCIHPIYEAALCLLTLPAEGRKHSLTYVIFIIGTFKRLLKNNKFDIFLINYYYYFNIYSYLGVCLGVVLCPQRCYEI